MSCVEPSYVSLRPRQVYSVSKDAVLIDSTAHRGSGLRINYRRDMGSNNGKALLWGEVLFWWLVSLSETC